VRLALPRLPAWGDVVTTHDEPFLDGMPEDPPRWVRPDESVRMSAQEFDWMLAAALPHAAAGGLAEALPQLAAIRLSVGIGLLTAAATDRHSIIRERRPVNQGCDGWTFLLRAADVGPLRALLRNLLRGLKDDAKREEPVDIIVEHTSDGLMLGVLGEDLDVRFTEQPGVDDFPNVDITLNRVLTGAQDIGPLDLMLNPTLLGRTIALQRAGRSTSLFRFHGAGGLHPVIVTPFDEDDDVVLALMPVRLGNREDT
jgi:hypothetical protein